MSNDRVRNRIVANSLLVADGLERLQEELLALFNSQYDKYRDDMLRRDDEHIAMLKTLVLEIGAVKTIMTDLSQQMKDVRALEGPASVTREALRRAIAAGHEALIERVDTLETLETASGALHDAATKARGAIDERIDALEADPAGG